jgi:hypothetical protein
MCPFLFISHFPANPSFQPPFTLWQPIMHHDALSQTAWPALDLAGLQLLVCEELLPQTGMPNGGGLTGLTGCTHGMEGCWLNNLKN